MSKRTALNEPYRGLVEAMSIPCELHERDGRRFASFGGAVPIHCCSPLEVQEKAGGTHHYCDIFSEQLFAPLGELAYVRLDENTAEKVFINRSKRMLLVSADGRVAQWRCAPTFESANRLLAGTPLVSKDGALLSLVTARRGNNYAVSAFEGEGGYFETSEPWTVVDSPDGSAIYGKRSFPSRDELRAFVQALPPAHVAPGAPTAPVLHRGQSPRIALVDAGGRQLSHLYLHGVTNEAVEYL